MKKELTTPQLTSAVQTLVETIRTEIEVGKERAYLAMEQEKRLTYWNVGKHIKEHLLQNEGREDYGAYVVIQLAQELNLSRNILYESVKCYEEYPRIVQAPEQLTWSHIRLLLTISETQARQALEQRIINEHISSKALRELVKSTKNKSKKDEIPILKVERGQPHIYCLKKLQGQTMVDLGFRTYMKSPFAEFERVNSKKQIIGKTEKLDQSYRFIPAGPEKVPHYTYKAYVIEVIDGDTLWVNIDLGFDMWSNQKLRLKGINTRELQSPQGQNAKEYMEAKLKGCEFIAIKTYWRDKFTRYLADIFYNKSEKDFLSLVQNGRHLNQELLDRGLAVRY